MGKRLNWIHVEIFGAWFYEASRMDVPGWWQAILLQDTLD